MEEGMEQKEREGMEPQNDGLAPSVLQVVQVDLDISGTGSYSEDVIIAISIRRPHTAAAAIISDEVSVLIARLVVNIVRA